MWAPSLSTIRAIQIFTLGLIFGSIILLVASYALEGGVGVPQHTRILTNVNAALFLRNRNSTSLNGRRKLALCLSSAWATLFLGCAGYLVYVARTQGMPIVYLVVGFDIPIAILMIIDAVLMELYIKQLNSQGATSSRNNSEDLWSRSLKDGNRHALGSNAIASESTYPLWKDGTNNQ